MQAKTKELDEAQELIRTIPNPQKEIEKIRAGMEELEDRSVSKKELPRIIQQLINKSSQLQIEIISIRPREDIKTQDKDLPRGVSKAYIEMIIKCPYNVLGDYLKALTELQIIFTIESIRVEKIEEAEETYKAKPEEKDLFATLILGTYTIWKI